MTATRSVFESQFAYRERILRQAALAALANPYDLAALVTPPTVSSGGTQDAALTRTYTTADLATFPVAFRGGAPIANADGVHVSPILFTAGASPGSRGVTTGAFDFLFDDDTVQVRLKALASGLSYRLLVDGVYVSKSFAALVASTDTWVKLAFTYRAVRHIRIEVNGEVRLSALAVHPAGDATAPAASRALYFAGDAFTAGIGADNPQLGWAAIAARLLGVADWWQAGLADTGYLASSSGASQSLRQGLTALAEAPQGFDAVILAGGLSDVSVAGYSPAALTAEVAETVQAARAYTDAPIIVFGPWTGSTGPSAAILAADDAIAAGVTQSAVSGAHFISVARHVPHAPIFGTGKSGAPNGSGNSDVHTTADGIHPTPSGHDLIGRWAARRIVETLAAL